MNIQEKIQAAVQGQPWAPPQQQQPQPQPQAWQPPQQQVWQPLAAQPVAVQPQQWAVEVTSVPPADTRAPEEKAPRKRRTKAEIAAAEGPTPTEGPSLLVQLALAGASGGLNAHQIHEIYQMVQTVG